jgi:hypothetical protein
MRATIAGRTPQVAVTRAAHAAGAAREVGTWAAQGRQRTRKSKGAGSASAPHGDKHTRLPFGKQAMDTKQA